MRAKFFSDDEKNNHIKGNLERHLRKYGRMNYVYGVMNKRNTDKMIIISDLSDNLVNNYLCNKYQNIDPVIIKALNRTSPFAWDEDLMINSRWKVKKVFEPMRPYNINSGYTFVLHDHNNNLAVLSLYMNNLSIDDVDDNINMYKNEIQRMFIYIHEMLLFLYQNDNGIDKNPLSPSAEKQV